MSRQSTVVVTLAEGSQRVKALDVFAFVRNTLSVAKEDVVCLQIDVSLNRFFVKCRTQVLFDRLCLSGKKRFLFSDGSTAECQVQSASGLGTRLVRVFNLPPELADDKVADAFRVYGRVVHVKREVWGDDLFKGVPNGVRQVLVELEKSVPSFVHIGRLGKFMTVHDQQVRTCAVCDAPGHTRQECPNRRNPRGWEKPKGSTLTHNNTGPIPTPVSQSLGPLVSQRLPVRPDPELAKSSSAPVSAPKAVPPGQISGQPTTSQHDNSQTAVNTASKGIPQSAVGTPTTKTASPPVPSSNQGTKPKQSPPVHVSGDKPIVPTGSSAESVGERSNKCRSNQPQPITSDWADEVEASSLIQLPGIYYDGVPGDDEMECQTNRSKRTRSLSPIGRDIKRVLPAATPVTVKNALSPVQ